jgi:uncharacterized protein (TIGR00730 family)
MSIPPSSIDAVCVYCGSSDAADVAWLAAAGTLGAALAADGLKLVYGGGGVGLMGACARAAHGAGGRVLGVMPAFLANREVLLEAVETIVVTSMHERKIQMFEASDAFVVLPGAIGTLEEAVELLSWRRLGLHAKPIVFFNPGDFWRPLFDMFDRFIETRLVPAEFSSCWRAVERIEQVIPALRAMPSGPPISAVMRVVA